MGWNGTSWTELEEAETKSLGMSNISSKLFLSDLSKALRKGFHSCFSISSIFLKEGTVLPISCFDTTNKTAIIRIITILWLLRSNDCNNKYQPALWGERDIIEKKRRRHTEGKKLVKPSCGSSPLKLKVGDRIAWINENWDGHSFESTPELFNNTVPAGKNFEAILLPGDMLTITTTRPGGFHYSDTSGTAPIGMIRVEEREGDGDNQTATSTSTASIAATPGNTTVKSVTTSANTDDGILERHSYNEIPPRVEYNLSARGQELVESVIGLLQWMRKRSSSSYASANADWKQQGLDCFLDFL